MAQASRSKAQQDGGSVRLVTKDQFFSKRKSASSLTSPSAQRYAGRKGGRKKRCPALFVFLKVFWVFSVKVVCVITLRLPLDLIFFFHFPSLSCLHRDVVFFCFFSPHREAQKPTECVSTVNIDHNTINWARYSSQLTLGGRITMETCGKHAFSHMHTAFTVPMVH